MNAIVSCKNKQDPLKPEGARVVTIFLPVYGDLFRHSKAANSAVRSSIWRKFELIQAFTVVLFTCKNEEDAIKKENTRVVTALNIDFLDAQEQLTP